MIEVVLNDRLGKKVGVVSSLRLLVIHGTAPPLAVFFHVDPGEVQRG
jgi:hypothetical protein